MGNCCHSQNDYQDDQVFQELDAHDKLEQSEYRNIRPRNIEIGDKYRVEYLNGTELENDIGFQASPMIADTAYWDGVHKVSMNILNQILRSNDRNRDKNICISSFSISAAFALIFAGIDKDSESCKQIASVLHYPTMMTNMDTPFNVSKMIIEQQLLIN